MIQIDLAVFRESIRKIEFGITRMAIMHWDGYGMQSLKEAYDKRVFEKLLGSLGQEIGVMPTPMHETGLLRQSFYIHRDGLQVQDYGFLLEGLDENQSTEGISDISQLEDQLYEKSVGEGRMIFGPIWDLTEDEIEVMEEQAARMFEKLYDGWM
jgi:hypothetical protein